MKEGFSHISHQEIDRRIVEWVTAGPRHACAVEEKTFRNLIEFLVPNYEVPPAKVVARLINARYCAAKAELRQTLVDVANKSKIALSIGSTQETQPRLILCAHFITNIWTIRSVVLSCLRCDVNNGDEIAKWINDKLKDLSLLPRSISAVLHDNEPFVTSGVHMLAEAYDWHTLLCCETILNYVVENACDHQELSEQVAEAESIIHFFHESETAKKLLHRAARKLEGNNCRNVARISQISFTCKGASIQNVSCMSTTHTLLTALQPFDAAMGYLKTTEFVPSSAVPILLSGLEKKLLSEIDITPVIKEEDCGSSSNQISQTPAQLREKLKRILLDSLRNLTTVFHAADITTLAAALDPRYKKLYFINADERQDVHSMISTECFLLHKDEVKSDELIENFQAKQPRLEQPKKSTGNSLMDDIMKLGSGCVDEENHQDSSQEILHNDIKKEMDEYFAEKPPPGEISPFTWWRANEPRFPMLARLARMYLCIPAVTLPKNNVLENTVTTPCDHVVLCKEDRISCDM